MWVGLGRFLGEYTLSVKVPKNKEDFRFVGRFLARWKFDFWVVKWMKCLILVGFDDIGYDKWFGGGDLGFCLILLGIFEVGVWMNQLNELLIFLRSVLVFATPSSFRKTTIFQK